MLTEIVYEESRWQEIGLERIAESAARATLSHLGLGVGDYQIGLLACDDTRIATLNAEFRGKASATNVLSWPSEERAPEVPGAVPAPPVPMIPGEPEELGDIAIAWDTCAREARDAGRPMADHVTHLIVHGVLHLLGYDHLRDPDATLMEGLEAEILGKLGVPDPYRD
ncbi:rRNA maturation RNase YbeY [Salinihabitans flavidus]|nr:rRNA maturation RNase YbeY [Salinihabitans flavidus]